MLRFDRIQHLLSPDELRDKLVVQIGVGSGGAAANDHLTMNGVRRWVLFDPDTYADINLVKHPRTRSRLGRLKVDNQRDWILDRNPEAEVEIFAEDVMDSERFKGAVDRADTLLCCADRHEVRLFVNDVAVRNSKPCVTASVYRQGFGGEVYAYAPGLYGCFDCMGRVATEMGWNIEGPIEPTPEEEVMVYGRGVRDFRSSGLSMDIQAIATIQARMVLDILSSPTSRKLGPPGTNWIVFYNRSVPGNTLSGALKSVLFKVRPRKDCQCAAPQERTA
jgi:molybdopterin/thiamine biosynthesis adenylyltransferase